VWRTVCALALDAMEHGRTVLWALAREEAGPTDKATDTSIAAAGRLASAHFWSSVGSFASAAGAVGEYDGLGQEHAFICRRAGVLQANVPSPA